MGASVQFIGVDQVLKAYENREVSAWSIWQGKMFMFKYEGADVAEGSTALQSHLEMLAGSTNAIYTLKVYEDIKPGEKIKSNTPDDGSFNFRLNFEGQEPGIGAISRYNNSNEILSKISAIQERLDAKEREEEEEDEEEDNPVKTFLAGVVSSPEMKPLITQVLTGIIANLVTQFKGAPAVPVQPPAVINGVNDPYQERLINESLRILKTRDPHSGEHLRKLASIAENNPEQFQMLVGLLANF